MLRDWRVRWNVGWSRVAMRLRRQVGFLFVLTGVSAVWALPPGRYPSTIETDQGLRIAGEGCRKSLSRSDGGHICQGVAITHGPNACESIMVPSTALDGGHAWIDFGSGCRAKAPKSGHLGFGTFYVEDAARRGFTVICDDAILPANAGWEEARRKCCKKCVDAGS